MYIPLRHAYLIGERQACLKSTYCYYSPLKTLCMATTHASSKCLIQIKQRTHVGVPKCTVLTTHGHVSHLKDHNKLCCSGLASIDIQHD